MSNVFESRSGYKLLVKFRSFDTKQAGVIFEKMRASFDGFVPCSQVMQSENVQKVISATAQERGLQKFSVRKDAERILNGLAADNKLWVLRLVQWLARCFLALVFQVMPCLGLSNIVDVVSSLWCSG